MINLMFGTRDMG